MLVSRCMWCYRTIDTISYFRPALYNLIGKASYFRSASSAYSNLKKINSKNIHEHGQMFCTKAKVPPNVLKSTANEYSGVKSSLFESEEVQTILKRMTSINLDKIFKSRKEDLSKPVYKVLTDDELKQSEEEIIKEAEIRLQMPPIRGLRQRIDVILSTDPEIIHHDEHGADYVFTDISASEDVRTRVVLVRENDTGTLREASWDERDRMQFMYWPKEGQTYEIAPMLQDENLPYIFDQLHHEDVLDFINVQCEVDAPDYIRVTHCVYEDIANREIFNILQSTCYYGGMIFYYVTNDKTNHVFGYFLRKGQIGDAADIVRLYSMVNADVGDAGNDLSDELTIRRYIENNGLEHFLKFLNDDGSELISQ